MEHNTSNRLDYHLFFRIGGYSFSLQYHQSQTNDIKRQHTHSTNATDPSGAGDVDRATEFTTTSK